MAIPIIIIATQFYMGHNYLVHACMYHCPLYHPLSLGFVQTINCTALPMEQYLSKLFSDHKEKKTCFRIELRKYRNSNKRCSTDTTWITGLDKTPQILEVDFLLLIIAGDIETNPGPVLTTLTLSTLHEELVELTNPLLFGKHLGIPQLVLDKLHPNGMCYMHARIKLMHLLSNYSSICM